MTIYNIADNYSNVVYCSYKTQSEAEFAIKQYGLIGYVVKPEFAESSKEVTLESCVDKIIQVLVTCVIPALLAVLLFN